MSLTITNSFVAHTTAKASDVNQNFQDVSTWANNLLNILLSITQRQGGSATDWTSAGASTQTVSGAIKVQCGTFTSNASTSTSGSFTFTSDTITFPTAFTNPPLVFAVVGAGTGWCKTAPSTASVGIVCWGITSS